MIHNTKLVAPNRITFRSFKLCTCMFSGLEKWALRHTVTATDVLFANNFTVAKTRYEQCDLRTVGRYSIAFADYYL